jgi:uncharacterized DUF497 family protein
MKIFNWNDEKNAWLKKERDISFEEIVLHIEQGYLRMIVEHSNPEKYPGQKIFIVQVRGYMYLVPFVENTREVFLKTIIPSRKATRDYLKGGSNE